MKDFDEFERLLASDECQEEWRIINDEVAESLASDNKGPSVFASYIAMRRARFELRKYHEWMNS